MSLFELACVNVVDRLIKANEFDTVRAFFDTQPFPVHLQGRIPWLQSQESLLHTFFQSKPLTDALMDQAMSSRDVPRLRVLMDLGLTLDLTPQRAISMVRSFPVLYLCLDRVPGLRLFLKSLVETNKSFGDALTDPNMIAVLVYEEILTSDVNPIIQCVRLGCAPEAILALANHLPRVRLGVPIVLIRTLVKSYLRKHLVSPAILREMLKEYSYSQQDIVEYKDIQPHLSFARYRLVERNDIPEILAFQFLNRPDVSEFRNEDIQWMLGRAIQYANEVDWGWLRRFQAKGWIPVMDWIWSNKHHLKLGPFETSLEHPECIEFLLASSIGQPLYEFILQAYQHQYTATPALQSACSALGWDYRLLVPNARKRKMV
jgi:hypothetical protein